MTAVFLNQLSKTYEGEKTPAVADLTLHAETGSFTTLLGPSGCGKSTIIKLMAGLLSPSSGDIEMAGQSVLGMAPEKRGTVVVFQDPLLFPHLDVFGNIAFGLKMQGVAHNKINDRVTEMVSELHLDGLERRKPSTLSGGQQQRVALARALVVRPRLLLLDEPLSNLDAYLRLELRDLITSLHDAHGLTTIMVTHDQQEAVAVSDKIALILDGKLAQFSKPIGIYNQPKNADVSRFFGCRNFIEGQVSGGLFVCPWGQLQLPPEIDHTGNGVLTIRPENIRLASELSMANQKSVNILEKTFHGTYCELVIEYAGKSMSMHLTPADANAVQIGDQIDVEFPPAQLWVMPVQ